MSQTRYIEILGAGVDDPGVLGGKGAALGRLVRLGHRVPEGFVITRHAFESALQEMALAPALESLSGLLRGSEDMTAIARQIRDTILSQPIPSHILQPILQTIEQLGLWQAPSEGIILRSSATIEDGSTHSFAGIFESIPITTAADFEPTLRQIWASVFAPRALTYFREIGVGETPAMAVVVQRFLRAERSGVMFTRFTDPAGRAAILVEHVEGDCEKLVKGEVTPERLWLYESNSISDSLSAPLAAKHARSLAQVAKQLEVSFGSAQDVEWVLYNNQLHVVQSRPITAAFAGGAPAVPDVSPGKSAILTGVPASSGLGSGPVHLVFNIEQALQLQTGSVLVTPMTNPDMVVAMRRSAAIVTDVGGIICHAAIVSRELGLPCVVGTETATSSLVAAEPVTVDGSTGRIFRGKLDQANERRAARRAEWPDLWSRWMETVKQRPHLIPIVSTARALPAMPAQINCIVLVPDLDLRTNAQGLWNDMEALSVTDCEEQFDSYLKRLAALTAERSGLTIHLFSLGKWLRDQLAAAVAGLANPAVTLYDEKPGVPPLILDPGITLPAESAAIPLACASVIRPHATATSQLLTGMKEAEAAALDTIKFFGHKPGSQFATMPAPKSRAKWWSILPEYGRFHQEFATAATTGTFEWLEVRPELVISALLKSLVQPGFEMVPRVLRFQNVPPLHIKWIKCRYHFRSDTFALVWQAIVRATWDEGFMVDLMRRVRASYKRLAEVLVLFPATTPDLEALSGNQIVALITSWWPRWVEFFALCWFIQAQGDDILFPFIEETVSHQLSDLTSTSDDFAWPGAAEFIAPTTPVLSGAYMADVALLREALLAAGLTSKDEAMAALDRGQFPAIAQLLNDHLRKWHWMRDRDLLFQPWDTPEQVIKTALTTETHAVLPYQSNLQRNLFALSTHFDLAHGSGRSLGLQHAARFLHDLNVERENHHVLWLKYSYPLRQLAVEVERRLIAAGSLEKGDIFFLQAPELIEAARNLPAPLPPELVVRIKNRRKGYLIEAKLVSAETEPALPEDDYY